MPFESFILGPGTGPVITRSHNKHVKVAFSAACSDSIGAKFISETKSPLTTMKSFCNESVHILGT